MQKLVQIGDENYVQREMPWNLGYFSDRAWRNCANCDHYIAWKAICYQHFTHYDQFLCEDCAERVHVLSRLK